MSYVKSLNDGRWYPEKTNWKYILDSLCDALGYFSESDLNSQLYIIIDSIADQVSQISSKNEC